MRIEEEWVYPATSDRVYAMMVDPAFQDAKCAAAKATEHSVDIEQTGVGHTVVTRRRMSTASFPTQFKSMVGDSLQIVETHAWGDPDSGGSREANVEVKIEGVPVGLTGIMTATPSGDDTVMALFGDLKARIPLFGGKVEQAAAPAIVAAIRSEAETGRDYLGN